MDNIHGKGSIDPSLIGKVENAFSKAGITKARRDKTVKMANAGFEKAGKSFKFSKSQALRGSKFFGKQIGHAIRGTKNPELTKEEKENLRNDIGF